ncbi:hypothetical protein CCAX7_50520 [Capsulimonas corticalis]|uniref:Uncharacterized protein n=1 Tax=Capsulimonas corticalis TaxID=2219043 RepID=A0A402CPH6_9BACT|nr:hypothetical protein [Capsulimonas corticalis]BDI33001.1 hypothetical protein CCAX7_50520 [Capsulimonas corticalis]
MNKIEKKQLPQLIALIALSVGVFGFFIYRMIAPTPAAAQSPKVAKSALSEAAKKVADAAAAASEIPPAPAPTALMRDPFQPAIADAEALAAYEKTQAPPVTTTPPAAPRASSRASFESAPGLTPMPVPHVAPLPSMGALPFSAGASGAPALSAAPAAPVTWTVTGVMGGDSGVAILRDGDKRRIVREGDLLEGGLHVNHISRGAVQLERDGQTYRLPLGGPKDLAAPRTPNADTAATPSSAAAPAGGAPAAPETPIAP